MTGLRKYTSLQPNVWRFPQWKDNTFYPAGSFVAVDETNPFDSEQITFSYYVATIDVPSDNKAAADGTVIVDGGSWSPRDSDSDWINHSIIASNPWSLTFDTVSAATIAGLAGEIAALTALFPLLGIDSDIQLLYRADSDFRVRDSEIDSDILQARHDALKSDSEYYILITKHLDSEEHKRRTVDSNLQVQILDNDSDITMEIHNRRSADSDLQIQIFNNDSDILQRWHDVRGIDSDRDSDFRLVHTRLDSDSDKLVNFIHRYEQRDSDIVLKFSQLDSDVQWLYTNKMNEQPVGGFPVGSMVVFPKNVDLPEGFLLCDGATFAQATYPELFDYLGQTTLPNAALSSGDATFYFGIATYSGAGIVPDSDFVQGVINATLGKLDSDINALYNRTDFAEFIYVPTTNQAVGNTYDTGVDISQFDDKQIFLNGVSITSYTFAGTIFTFNFSLRGNVDEVTIKLRR